ncbi:MAG: hypothetical protein JWP81_4767 [Ferruginibacter sp.]|nr:hypothetical protein [Ferruginibacter sp.]
MPLLLMLLICAGWEEVINFALQPEQPLYSNRIEGFFYKQHNNEL